MLFGFLDYMNFKMLLLKNPTLSELRISRFRLFHSFIVDRKGVFKEVMFRTNLGNIIGASCQISSI